MLLSEMSRAHTGGCYCCRPDPGRRDPEQEKKKKNKALSRQLNLERQSNQKMYKYNKLPVVYIGDVLITTTDFVLFRVKGIKFKSNEPRSFTLGDLQKKYATVHRPSRTIYEVFKEIEKESQSMIYALALLNRLIQAPTAYENDEDKILGDIVATHIMPLFPSLCAVCRI